MGLTFSTDFENLVAVSKLILGYFCLVYIGYAMEPLLVYLRDVLVGRSKKRAEGIIHESQMAIDDWEAQMSRSEHSDEDDSSHEPDYIARREQQAAKDKFESQKVRLDALHERTIAIFSYSLNVLLALAIAVSVLILPTDTLKNLVLKVGPKAEVQAVAAHTTSPPLEEEIEKCGAEP